MRGGGWRSFLIRNTLHQISKPAGVELDIVEKHPPKEYFTSGGGPFGTISFHKFTQKKLRRPKVSIKASCGKNMQQLWKTTTEAPFKGSLLPSDNWCPQPDPEGFGTLHQTPGQGPQGFQSVHRVETPLHGWGGGMALPTLQTCQKCKSIKWTKSAPKV